MQVYENGEISDYEDGADNIFPSSNFSCHHPQIFELILSDWNKQNTGNVNRYKL